MCGHTNEIETLEMYRDMFRSTAKGRVAAVWGGDFEVDQARAWVLQAGGCVGFEFAREL